jgi:hypothetical protein
LEGDEYIIQIFVVQNVNKQEKCPVEEAFCRMIIDYGK